MKRSVEISVGVFMLLGIACVAYLTIRLGKMELIGGDYYQIQGRFTSVAGLRDGAPVLLAGVPIGQVTHIRLDTVAEVAMVGMKIRTDVKLTDDAIASVKTNGLIGDKYVFIEPGAVGEPVKDGGVLTETESSVDLEEILGKYAFGQVKDE